MTDQITIMLEIDVPDWLREAVTGNQVQPTSKAEPMDFPLPREMSDPMGLYVEQLAEFIKAAGPDGITRQAINKAFRYRLTNNAHRDMALSKLPKGFEKRNERYQASDIMRTRHRWFWVGDR